MALEEAVLNFAIQPYLFGTPKRSSFLSSVNGSLAFFVEAPAGRIFLVRTQARDVVDRIQNAVHVNVDGKFGGATMAGILNAARADGVEFPANAPATAPVMAYALGKAYFDGTGRIGFPANMVWPDVQSAPLSSNTSRFLQMLDLSTGQYATVETTRNANGVEVSLPSTWTLPPTDLQRQLTAPPANAPVSIPETHMSTGQIMPPAPTGMSKTAKVVVFSLLGLGVALVGGAIALDESNKEDAAEKAKQKRAIQPTRVHA